MFNPTTQPSQHERGKEKRWYVFILTFLFVNSAQAKAHRSELMYTHTPRAILKKVIGADNQHILQLVKQRERRERKKATTMTLPKFESRLLLLRWERREKNGWRYYSASFLPSLFFESGRIISQKVRGMVVACICHRAEPGLKARRD